MMENLTNEIYEDALRIINEIEEMGGMSKAVAEGIPKLKIEECAAKKQANIDSGKEVIVGVNKYRLDKEERVDVLAIDNTTVRKNQVDKIQALKDKRDDDKTMEKLGELVAIAKQEKEGNLLEEAVECAKARATLGEISDAMVKVLKNH